MGFNKELNPFRRALNIFWKKTFLRCDLRPTVSFHHSNLQTSPYCIHVFETHTLPKQRQHYLCQSLRNKTLTFGSNISFLQSKCNVFNVCDKDKSRRNYHMRSKLSVSEDVFSAYLQSLVNELKILQEEQAQNRQHFKTEKEENLYHSRYQFLISANEVISRIVEKQNEVAELKSLSSDEKDSDMKQMMHSEIQTLGEDILQLEDELIDALMGEEPADNNDIILEVSAGVGGQEAMLFCADVFNMYCQYGLGKGWNVALVGKDESELGGYRKASIEICGIGVYRCLKHEAGVHRVQRIPKTEKAGRVHTSTVTVSVLPQPREIDIQIEKKDLKIETFRGSGPGGQSVNTTDSAVRITHLPTGTVAECKKERSQIKNKEHAMKVLKLRIYQAQLEEEEANMRATRKMQVGSRGRSEKIRTYNFQQDRVTDHRVKENYSNLPDFMLGGEGLDDLMTSLAKDYKCKVAISMIDEFEISLQKKK